MTIEKRIKLDNNFYYVAVDVEYKVIDNNTMLCLKNSDNEYFDGGDFSKLLERIEETYEHEKALKYDSKVWFMADSLYLYDRIPFLSGIKDAHIGSNDNLPYSIGYIPKDELDSYINSHNIVMRDNSNFKLFDERTWNI